MGEPLFRPVGPAVPTMIVKDARTLGGMPVLSGTRIPAETIVACLRAGEAPADIRVDYPTLPPDGIAVVQAWAETEYGADWRSMAIDPRA